MEKQVLVKYCFSGLKSPLTEYKEPYYSTIISELVRDGIIENLCTYKAEPPFGFEDEVVSYQIENGGTYTYSFTCNESRSDVIITFNFSIKFTFETRSTTEMLYVEICSDNYTFAHESDSNCLEVLKHKLRSKVSEWKNRYCLVDMQSAFYASNLYPRIYEIENLFRYYVNDVFTKVFGANWWNETIAANIKKNRKARIEDTREYSGQYRDIQPYLMSLELGDLMEIAKTKTFKWIPAYDTKIEQALNHSSNADVISLLKAQCQPQIDIWDMCFGKHFGADFADTYRLFEKRRNQVAHNKLLDNDAFTKISALCDKVLAELTSAYKKFCEEFISEEEQELIDEYKADLAEQAAIEQEHLDSIAESESGVQVHSDEQIIDIFNEVLHDIYNELVGIFEDRQDVDFDSFCDLENNNDEQNYFQVSYKIDGKVAHIFTEININDSQGEVSELTIRCKLEDAVEECVIEFTNGEYSFNSEQSYFVPETQDEIDEASIENAKQVLCDFIEENFPNLRAEADTQNHLAAMGKSASITAENVYCSECGEEYICIDEAYAPTGTCLNCGAQNELKECIRCYSLYNADEGIADLCDYCYEKIDKE